MVLIAKNLGYSEEQAPSKSSGVGSTLKISESGANAQGKTCFWFFCMGVGLTTATHAEVITFDLIDAVGSILYRPRVDTDLFAAGIIDGTGYTPEYELYYRGI